MSALHGCACEGEPAASSRTYRGVKDLADALIPAATVGEVLDLLLTCDVDDPPLSDLPRPGVWDSN